MNNFENPYFVILLIYIAILGLCIGSFLNVVILRGLSGESIVFTRSHCPKCNKQLKWYMNIPLLSYVFLKGKCAYCKTKISIQYPFIEFLTALLFTYSFLHFGLCYDLIFIFIALSLLIVMCATDIKNTVIIDTHAYILAVVGLIYSFFDFSALTVIQSVLGAIVGFLFFEISSFITKKMIGYRMFGEGDSLIALGLGAFFGLKTMCIIIPLSFLIQFVFSIPFLICSAFKQNKKKLALSYIVIVFGTIIFGILNYIHLPQNDYILYLIYVLIVSLFLIWALVVLINDLKEKTKENHEKYIKDELETSFYALPFGPALILSGGLCLFYLDFIKNIIKNFL